MAAVVTVLALSTALLGALVIGLLRSHADILRALHDLGVEPGGDAGGPRRFGPVRHVPAAGGEQRRVTSRSGSAASGAGGTPAPDAARLPAATDVQGVGPDGTSIHVAVTSVDHQTLLAFLTTGCELCLGFWEALADPNRRERLGPGVRIVAVTQDETSEMPSAVIRLAPSDITTVMAASAWEAYGVPMAPFFALVDGPTGRVVGEGAAPTWDHLVDLLGRTVADGARRSGRTSATPARQGWAGREADTDAALLAAGIVRGDPRLHHDPTGAPHGDEQREGKSGKTAGDHR